MPKILPNAVTKRGKGRPVGTKKLSKADQIKEGEGKVKLPKTALVKKLREVKDGTPSVTSLSKKKAKRIK